MPRRTFSAGTVTNTTGAPLRLTFHATSTTGRRETDLWTVDGSSNPAERIPNGVILTDASGAYSAFAGPDDCDLLWLQVGSSSASRTQLTASGTVAGGTTVDSATYATQRALREAVPLRNTVKVTASDFQASNASAPLTITTYDGSGQLTHPSVYFTPEGWNGYRYWMAATPYPSADSTLENPSIYVSNDGTTWAVPPGVTNPIVPRPPGTLNINSDTDLEMGPDGRLYMFWRSAYLDDTPQTEAVRVISSADGVTWTPPVAAITSLRTSKQALAPSVVHDGTRWNLWAVDIDTNPNQVVKYVCAAADPTIPGNWTGPTVCTITHPLGAARDIWHLDVNKWGDEYHLIFDDTTPQGSSGGNLYLATSRDLGLTWAVAPLPFLSGRGGSFWDATLYRSTMVPTYDGTNFGYEIWYSSASPTYRIGHTFGSFNAHKRIASGSVHGIDAVDQVNVLLAAAALPPFVLGDTYVRADSASSVGSATSGQAYTVWAGTAGISSRQGYAAIAGNTKVAVDSGLADGTASIRLSVFDTQGWLIFRGVDTSNYWRFGGSSGSYKLDKVVAGVVTTLAGGLGTPASGDVLSVNYVGSVVTAYINGVQVAQVTDSFGATNTMIGWQATTIAGRFKSLTCRTP